MDAKVIAPLNALDTSLDSLLFALANTNTFSGAPTSAQDILSADDALTSSLNLLKQHQDNYTHILNLNAEAERLQAQLRDIVRTCVDLRTELGSIHKSILLDEDEEPQPTKLASIDGGKNKNGPTPDQVQPIDYETLLAFAARIGKHNAVAAREAEEESTRRKIDAATKKLEDRWNGDTVATATATTASSTQQQDNTQNQTQESQANLSAINDVLSVQRSTQSMAFPPPDRLRMGLLGQLQLLREQEGEEAMTREMDSLIRQSEGIAPPSELETATNDPLEEGKSGDVIRPPAVDDAGRDHPRPPLPAAPSATSSVPRANAPKPKPKQNKVSLDFDEFGSDEDE